MDVALLRQVQAKIRHNPRCLNMGTWIERTECGTVACIAGWAAILVTERPEEIHDAQAIASEALGLTPAQASELFLLFSWPQPFRGRYRFATSIQECAHAACDRIDAFIAQYGPAVAVATEEPVTA